MYNKKLLSNIALTLGVAEDKLYGLIAFESNWNPQAKNPFSSAKGLLQFTDSTAQSLGFSNSQQLIDMLPTADMQLQYAVLPYLQNYAPFPTTQSLYMAVFYPAAMYWPEYKPFPDYVQRVNPGIRTPGDYMKKVYKKLSLRYVPRILYYLIGGYVIYNYFKSRR